MPEAFRALLADDRVRWERVIKAADVKAELDKPRWS
jgi:hypothetical protein